MLWDILSFITSRTDICITINFLATRFVVVFAMLHPSLMGFKKHVLHLANTFNKTPDEKIKKSSGP